MHDSIPPFSAEAEKSVLGSMLLDTNAADTAMQILTREQFYRPEHGDLFEAIARQRRSNIQPDEVTTAIEFAKINGMGENDAAGFLLEIMEAVPHSAHVAHYAEIVRDKFQRRAGINALKASLAKIADPNRNTTEVLSDAADTLLAAVAGGVMDVPQSADAVLHDAMHSEEVRKTPTGFVDIDFLTGGLAPQTLTVIGARPSVGKTALAVEIARRLAQHNSNVLLFSLEMSRRSIGQRIGAMSIGVPFAAVRDDKLEQHERHQLEELSGAEWMRRLIVDEQTRTVEEINTLVRLYARQRNVSVVIVDYLQLIPPTNQRQPREQQVSEISRRLKQVSKAANVAIVCLAQLNRDVEKRDQKRPKLSDLRESGAIEQDADQAWLLWRPNKDTDSVDDHGELIVAKSRNGQTGTVKLAWHGPTMSYADFHDGGFQW